MHVQNLQKFQDKPRDFLLLVVRQKKFLGFGIVISVILARLTYTSIPFVAKKITDALAYVSGDFGDVYFFTFLLLTLMVVSMALYRLTGFFAAKWIPYSEVYAAQVSFDYLLGHSAQYFANRLSGKLQNKIFNIAQAINGIFPIIFWTFIDLFVKIVGSAILAFMVHAIVGYVFLFFVLVSIMYSAFISRRLSQNSWERAEAMSEARGVMVDIVSNVLAVKQNVAVDRESRNARDVMGVYKAKSVRNWKFFEKALLFNNVILITMFSIVILSSIYLWQQGITSAGDITMLFLIMMGLYGDLQFLSMNFNRFMEQYGQLREGLEEIFEPYEIVDEKETSKTVIENGEIVFDCVRFQYEEDEQQSIFDNLSVAIPSGQKVGLVGESGAGKSTFVNLLLRFVEPEKGVISIDGNDIACMRQDDLRDSIAYVPQEALLFHRSLRDNIVYSNPDATEEELVTAAKRAHASEFIDNLADKYETRVGERGVKLSGGQKQRVMIARAMLKESPILVLDEATSSLDSKSEKYIQEALDELMKNRTTIVIAHRLSTLKKMDRIIVFDDGKVVEDGTHEDLLKNKGKYHALWQHQSGMIDEH